jgi:phage FluMu protein Com
MQRNTIKSAETTVSDTDYLVVVNGVIADAMPPVALRRSGKAAQAGLKEIKCPQCRGHFFSVPRDTTVRIYRAPKVEQRKAVPGMQPRICYLQYRGKRCNDINIKHELNMVSVAFRPSR